MIMERENFIEVAGAVLALNPYMSGDWTVECFADMMESTAIRELKKPASYCATAGFLVFSWSRYDGETCVTAVLAPSMSRYVCENQSRAIGEAST